VIEANPKVNVTDEHGRTPLIALCAIFYPNRTNAANLLGIARLLIKRGANPGAQQDDGWTALHYAVMNNNPALVRLLVDSGAPILATSMGLSPLGRVDAGTSDEVAGLLYDHAVATKYDVKPAEAVKMIPRLVTRKEFKSVVTLAEDGLIKATETMPTIVLVPDHDKSVAQLKGHVQTLFATVTAELAAPAKSSDTATAAMAHLLIQALAQVEREAVEEHGESVSGAGSGLATW